MSSILLTIAIAFIVVLLAIGLLAIGWLTTGKSILKSGACGRNPTKKDENCSENNASCGLCQKKDKK